MFLKKNIILILLLCPFGMLMGQTVDFTISTSNGLFCNPQAVTFTQSCSGNPAGYIWTFGNGQSGTNAIETISYAAAGTYTVTLTALYANNAISTSKSVTIHPNPVVTLTANRNNMCQPGTVNFTAMGSAFITSYEWDFGDGSGVQTSFTNTISHNYITYGNYTASVKGITSFGCFAVSNYVILINRFAITGNVSPVGGCVPVNATLSVATSFPPGDAPSNYSWDFGDGSPIVNGITNSISHPYNTTATINTAAVFITSVQGCTNQFIFPAFAYGSPPFNTIAQTISVRDTFCGSEFIDFFGSATNATDYIWDFGDGTATSTTGTQVSHKYSSLGNMQVIVTPYFNGCAGIKDTINIFIEGVLATFNYNNTCGSKNVYQFNNTSLGNLTHFALLFTDIPPLIDSLNFHPTPNFTSHGFYIATLSINDSTTGCTDALTAYFFTAQPLFSSTTSSVCKDSLIIYRVSNTYDFTSGFLYEFHVNGNIVNNGLDSVLNYYPANHGNFIEYVVINDNVSGTCSDTLFLNSNTTVKGPVVNFTSPSRLCADSTVTFTNNSYPFYAGETITKWNWDFGDSKKDSVQNPLPHFYPTPAAYTVILTATDGNGCAQKFQKQITVDPLPKISIFPAIDTICLAKDSATLRAYTVDSLLWIPSAFINCINCDTVKVYPPLTMQYIAQATNSVGCRSYDTSLIKVYAPINLQVFPADTLICPKQPVSYNLNTVGITTWAPSTYLNSANIKNPVAVADSTISYTVIVADSAGCFADTVLANLIVNPIPTVDAGPDRVLPYNTPFVLSPAYSTNAAVYSWTPSLNLSCYSCPFPSGTAQVTTTYRIDVATINGCTASDAITIFVACDKANLLLPTAFTPDNNGKNDYFYPLTRGYKKITKFIIYNRLGNKVFERNNFTPNLSSLGWDGNIKGSGYGSSTETFVWYVEAVCDLGQTIIKKGTVVLIR